MTTLKKVGKGKAIKNQPQQKEKKPISRQRGIQRQTGGLRKLRTV